MNQVLAKGQLYGDVISANALLAHISHLRDAVKQAPNELIQQEIEKLEPFVAQLRMFEAAEHACRENRSLVITEIQEWQ